MYTCKTECYFRERVWKPGEEFSGKVEESEEKMVDRYFTTDGIAKEEDASPKTLKDVQESKGGVFE
jgi:hypothetical protein